jgi:23S rRNA pseudouridine1911/1915/1917 synthase
MIPDLEERIIYEDNNLLVVNKPYDTPSTGQSLQDHDCLQFWLMKRQGCMVWAIHQLDADTTGVNIFVKEKRLVPIYKESLEKTNSNKEYLAIIHGSPSWDSHDEFGPIGKINERELGVTPSGKIAHSKFTIQSRTQKYALVRVNIYTGRTHQIRIHLSHLGHPVIGDDWYCKPRCNLHLRQALHCQSIDLHKTGELFTAPLPGDLKGLLKDLSLEI